MDARAGLVLVNGPAHSVQGPRARALFENIRILYKTQGRFGSIGETWAALKNPELEWIYCIDLGFPTSLLSAVRRRTSSKVRLIYELGDPARPLLGHQDRARAEVVLAHQFDRWLPSTADRIVFRGTYLEEYFRRIAPSKGLPPSLWLPDGADCSVFRPQRNDEGVLALRRAHNLEGHFVVGLVGNIHENPRYRLFYGWELAEALALIPAHIPITGVVVGDGPGRPALEATRARLGLGNRLQLVGRVPHEQVPLWMNAFDVGLSTQSDDPVGWGRTTAKLPEYLASGTAVLCSDVGEAHRLLKESQQTLPYRGMRDENYPARLATRLLELRERDLNPQRVQNRMLAARIFDYRVLRQTLQDFLESVS